MINIKLPCDDAYSLAILLGIQGIDDTRHIINKYGLKIKDYEMEDILQHLFNLLSCELEIEM